MTDANSVQAKSLPDHARLERVLLLALSLVGAYALLAYLALPALWTHYEHQKGLANLPMVTRTAQGIPGDPINVGLVGDNQDVLCAMQAADWYPADPRFEVSRLEQDTVRSYSIDTIEKLRPTLAPGDELYFLIGADAFAEIRSWHRWQDVVHNVRFLVVSRPGHEYELPPETQADRIDRIDLPISSSEIRHALSVGEIPIGLPSQVLQYAQAHKLYATPRHSGF